MADANGSHRLLMFGPPGSGKGTQAAILGQRLGIPAISTGEMLRGAVSEGSDLGRRVEGIMAAGTLVDDQTMAEVVAQRLARDDAEKGFLLDGYPRTQGQAETLRALLEDRSEDLDAVIMLDVPEQVLVERALARSRADDKEPVIRQRLAVYREQTEPLIGYYRGFGLLRAVDGHQPVDKVTDSILAALKGER